MSGGYKDTECHWELFWGQPASQGRGAFMIFFPSHWPYHNGQMSLCVNILAFLYCRGGHNKRQVFESRKREV